MLVGQFISDLKETSKVVYISIKIEGNYTFDRVYVFF